METLAVILLAALVAAVCGLLVLFRRAGAEEASRKAIEERLALVLEYAPVAIGVHNTKGEITHLNRSFRKLFGYGPEELRTLADWWPRAYPDPERRAAAQALTQRMIAASRETCSESGGEVVQVTCRDGTLRDVEFHYIDLGRVGLWTMLDVTDHRRIEEAARLANDHLLSQLGEIQRLQLALQEQATRDPLTGLFNRRYLDDTLEREIARAIREGYPVTVMMLDIDHFKRINDTYGHLAGDEMLRVAARLLHSHARQEDIVCRFGGEEFAIVLPKMGTEAAEQRAELWRREFEEEQVVFGSFVLQATISIGVAAFPGNGRTRDELIDAADHALYEAKSEGRNRIRMADGIDVPAAL